MSKRKTYEERINALNQKAKDEIYNLLHAHNIKRLGLSGEVHVVSQHPGGGFDFFPVTVVELVEQKPPHTGEVLCFDYEGGIAWYTNPNIWCQICDEVRKKLRVK